MFLTNPSQQAPVPGWVECKHQSSPSLAYRGGRADNVRQKQSSSEKPASVLWQMLTPTIYFTLTVKDESAASRMEIQNFYSANNILTQERNRLWPHTESHSRWICSTAKWFFFSHLLNKYLLNTIASRQCSRYQGLQQQIKQCACFLEPYSLGSKLALPLLDECPCQIN